MSVWLSAREAFQHVLSIELVEEVARRKIERCIREGKIPGHAAMLDYGDIQGREMVIPETFWQHEMSCQIDFEANTVVREKWDWNDDRQRFNEPATLRYAYSVQGFQLSRRHVFEVWPRGNANPQVMTDSNRKDNRGAKAGLDWEKVLIEAARFMYSKQEAGKQEDLIQHIREWLDDPEDNTSPTTMKDHLRPMWQAFKKIDGG